jgi:hypothetical protein
MNRRAIQEDSTRKFTIPVRITRWCESQDWQSYERTVGGDSGAGEEKPQK